MKAMLKRFWIIFVRHSFRHLFLYPIFPKMKFQHGRKGPKIFKNLFQKGGEALKKGLKIAYPYLLAAVRKAIFKI